MLYFREEVALSFRDEILLVQSRSHVVSHSNLVTFSFNDFVVVIRMDLHMQELALNQVISTAYSQHKFLDTMSRFVTDLLCTWFVNKCQRSRF